MGYAVLVSSASACNATGYSAAIAEDRADDLRTRPPSLPTSPGNAGKFVCVRGQNAGSDTGAHFSVSSAIAYPGPTLAFNSAGVDNAYVPGEHIEVTASFGYNVDVTGTPRIGVVVGSGTKYATYNRGTGTSALVFRYTVARGDSDSDGVSINANALALNGGTIQDADDTDAVITHSAVAASTVRRVLAPPTVTSATVKDDLLTLVFSKDMNTTSLSPPTAFRATVGSTTTTAASYTMEKRQALITFASSFAAADTITVSYTAPPSGAFPQGIVGQRRAVELHRPKPQPTTRARTTMTNWSSPSPRAAFSWVAQIVEPRQDYSNRSYWFVDSPTARCNPDTVQ